MIIVSQSSNYILSAIYKLVKVRAGQPGPYLVILELTLVQKGIDVFKVELDNIHVR